MATVAVLFLGIHQIHAFQLQFQFQCIPSTTIPTSKISRPRLPTTALFDTNDSNKKASVQITTPQLPTNLNPTSLLDYILSLVTSDLSSIILGSIGILLALSNRLSSIDYEATAIALNEAADMGSQTRMDLLAVFSAGAVLLNGVSKLDVTSVLAERVLLDGKDLQSEGNGIVYNDAHFGTTFHKNLAWPLKAIRTSSPASTAVLLAHDAHHGKWNICALDGIVPYDENLWNEIPQDIPTPILDRFLKENQGNKESYLPTLQALPGRVEFTYLPQNTQEVLLLPIDVHVQGNNNNNDSVYDKAALVLGSDTAKTFTPRDVAWCQVLASRIGHDL